MCGSVFLVRTSIDLHYCHSSDSYPVFGEQPVKIVFDVKISAGDNDQQRFNFKADLMILLEDEKSSIGCLFNVV